MEEQTKKIIETIEKIHKELPDMDRNTFYATTNIIDSILVRHFSSAVNYKKDLQTVRQHLGILVSSNSDKNIMGFSLPEIKIWFNGLLDSIKKEIEQLGLPSSTDIKIDKSVNVNVTQNQEQSQSLIIQNLIDNIKNELTGKQYNELVSIAKNEKTPEKAKGKIIQKLQDFGLNICASIVANLLTNPSVWTLL